MRRFLILGALFGAMALVATKAEAQRGPFGAGTFGSPGGFGLLMNKGVQEELKVTDDQMAKLADKRKEMGDKMQEIRGKLKDASDEERVQMMQKVFKESQEFGQKAIGEILKPEQAKRLKQIERQQNIVTTLTSDDEAKKELKLTADQSDKIKTISEELSKETRALGANFKENPRETQEKMAGLRKEASAKAANVLTDEQKKTWKEMIGEPFEVKFDGFGIGRKKDN